VIIAYTKTELRFVNEHQHLLETFEDIVHRISRFLRTFKALQLKTFCNKGSLQSITERFVTLTTMVYRFQLNYNLIF